MLLCVVGTSYGQKRPPLTHILQSILERYPDGGQILKVNFCFTVFTLFDLHFNWVACGNPVLKSASFFFSSCEIAILAQYCLYKG